MMAISRKSYLKNKVKRKAAKKKPIRRATRKYKWVANWDKGFFNGLKAAIALWLYKVLAGKEWDNGG